VPTQSGTFRPNLCHRATIVRVLNPQLERPLGAVSSNPPNQTARLTGHEVPGEQASNMHTTLQGIVARIPAGVLLVGLFGLLLIGSVWFLLFDGAQQDLERARAGEIRKNENLVLAHEEQVIRLLKEVDQLLLLLKNQYELGGTKINLPALFADGTLDAGTFTYVGVIDEHGDVIATGRESKPVNLADRAFFKEHQRSDSKALRIGEPVLGRSSGRWAIPLTRRFNKPDGSFGGVVDVAVDADHFTSLFQKSELGPADVMSLVRTDGIVLALRRGEETSFGEDVSKSPLMAELARSPVGSYSSIGLIDPTRKFFSYRRLPDYPVVVLVGTAETDALAPVRDRYRRSVFQAIMETAFVGAFCVLIITMLLRQKRANARIQEHLAQIDQARDAIVVRGLDGRVQFWNKGAERIYGWSAAEASGQPLEELLHADPTKLRQATETVLSSGEWTGEVTHLHRHGHPITVDDHWTLLRDELGRPKSILTIETDITKRLLMEARLRQSQHLEAIGQLTGGVAHDFNNLLTVILGNAEMLTDKLRSNPDLRKLAEMNVSAASRGAELTSRLLAFARRQALDPKAVDANKLLMGIHDLLRRTLPENIEIELAQGAGLWLALIDPGQLEDAVLNLCLNARDAMPSGGRLTIETANERIDQEYAAQQGDIDAGQYVLITVTDNGTGIEPKDLNRVFDPFFTTKEFGKGTGLGLSMVYGFVKQSRGHIRIYSEVGHGTAVKMYLPRASGIDDAAEESPAELLVDFRGGEKILLVEDDEYVRNYAKDQLLDLGYCVFPMKNGADALECLQQVPDIDLLFTDVVMPGGIGGRELAEQARKLRPGLKVLYTSGYTENSIVHQGRLDKGVHLLNKPYRRIELAQKIRAVLA
jgi:PAS domain S-box-containing protein